MVPALKPEHQGHERVRQVVEELQRELFHNIPVSLLPLVMGRKLAQLCQNKLNIPDVPLAAVQ